MATGLPVTVWFSLNHLAASHRPTQATRCDYLLCLQHTGFFSPHMIYPPIIFDDTAFVDHLSQKKIHLRKLHRLHVILKSSNSDVQFLM